LNTRRLISLLVIVSLLAGCINSMLLISSRAARHRTLLLAPSEVAGKGTISAPDHNHGIFDAAVVTASHSLLPPPAALFCIWAILLVAAAIIRRPALHATGSSPPFRAARLRQTYLRISVLRI
jgi:hypothetical protein